MGIVLISPEKITVEKSLRLGFPAINNEAKYKALLVEMAMVNKLGSRLVVGQINGEFEARDQQMQGYFSKVRQAQANFEAFTVKQIPRGQNSHANLLAMLAISLESGLPRVIIVEDMMVFGHNNQMSSGIYSIKIDPS